MGKELTWLGWFIYVVHVEGGLGKDHSRWGRCWGTADVALYKNEVSISSARDLEERRGLVSSEGDGRT